MDPRPNPTPTLTVTNVHSLIHMFVRIKLVTVQIAILLPRIYNFRWSAIDLSCPATSAF